VPANTPAGKFATTACAGTSLKKQCALGCGVGWALAKGAKATALTCDNAGKPPKPSWPAKITWPSCVRMCLALQQT
jgi:hypothetical protein